VSSAVVDRVSSKVAARQGVAEGIASYTAIRTAEDLKSQWTVKRLDEVCAFHNGLWKGKKPPYVRVGVIRNTNFAKDGILDDSDIAYLDVEEKQFQKRKLKFGDLILEKSGGGPKQAVGRVVLFDKVDGDYSFSNFTSAIRVNDQRQLAFHYLHKYLHWIYASGVTESMQSHSTGIRNLDGHAYKGISIAFPSLTEQQRIVAILDEAFADIAKARSNAERNLRNARELLDSYLQSVFSQRGDGWRERAVSEISDHSLGKMLDKAKNRGELQPYLRNLNVRWFDFDLNDLSEMRFTGGENHKYSIVRGDVVICEGGYPGRAAIWDKDESIYFQKALHRVRFHNKRHNRWFLYYLFSQHSAGELKRLFTGTGIQHFTGASLARFIVPIPPDDVVELAVEKIEALFGEVRHLTSIYRQKIAALDELKQSLLDRAFSGAL